jgi:hypothetical protein
MAEAKGHTADIDTTGYRRLLVDSNGGAHYWPVDQSYRPAPEQKHSVKQATATTINWGRVHQKFMGDLDPHIGWLCDNLALGKETVRSMQVGWSQSHFAFTFPMRCDQGKVVGFRLRKRDGSKYAIRGSREGLFNPNLLKHSDTLVVVAEGPTDTMHLHAQGYHTIGRPSCRGAVQYAVDYCASHPVVVVSDSDSPGRIGAADLAKHLLPVCPEVKIIEPLKGKDAREWIVAGATKDIIDLVINNAYPESTDDRKQIQG